MNTPTSLEAAQAVLSADRVLDAPVSEYRPQLIGASLKLGTAAELQEYYRQNLVDVPGNVLVGKTEITTAPEVTAILRALLYTGCCRIEERSLACREVFTRILKTGKQIGVEDLLSSFVTDFSNPFVKVLQDAIRTILGRD